MYVRGAQTFADMTNVSKDMRAELEQHFTVDRPEVVTEQISNDGTRKWLMEFADGQKAETVFIPETDRVVVQGVNIVTKHVKPSRENPQGGIQKREAPIHLSNVMLADPKTGDPTRVRFKTLESGTKVRVAVKSGEQIDK